MEIYGIVLLNFCILFDLGAPFAEDAEEYGAKGRCTEQGFVFRFAREKRPRADSQQRFVVTSVPSSPRTRRKMRSRSMPNTEVSSTATIWFRGGLVFKAHRLLYHSTPGFRVIKKKKHLAKMRSSSIPNTEVSSTATICVCWGLISKYTDKQRFYV